MHSVNHTVILGSKLGKVHEQHEQSFATDFLSVVRCRISGEATGLCADNSEFGGPERLRKKYTKELRRMGKVSQCKGIGQTLTQSRALAGSMAWAAAPFSRGMQWRVAQMLPAVAF